MSYQRTFGAITDGFTQGVNQGGSAAEQTTSTADWLKSLLGGEQSGGAAGAPAAASLPGPASSGISTTTLLVGAGVAVGAYLIFGRKKRR